VTLGIITAVVFATVVTLCRPLLNKYFILTAPAETQPRNAFFIEIALCLFAGIILGTYNNIVYGFPYHSLFPLMTGCLIAGFFIGLDAALSQERKTILLAMEKDNTAPLAKSLFSMTHKFTFITVTLTLFIALLMALVFTRDIVWLTKITENQISIQHAQISVGTEIFFIMAVLMALIINLIISYSRNLRLLFKNETKVLEQVSDGDLSQKVPVATNDEFGVIAGHTNDMIDGLRHRFELLSAIKMAEEIQQNLLPRTCPPVKGMDISGTSLYCDNTGGDYYDYFPLPDNRFGIAVADVCGHDVGAAILMTSVRAFLHMAVAGYRSPAELLNIVNQYITRDCSRSGRFTSMFFLEISPGSRSLCWVRAGHEPALFFDSAARTFSLLEGPGLVLGVDQKHRYQNSSREKINRDDIIIIVTDGIRESKNSNGEMFGQLRLEKTILDSSSKTAESIKNDIISAVTSFREGISQEDDITLVVVKIS